MISMLSTTKQTDQLSTLRNVLTVVSKLYDRATAGSRTSTYGRTSGTVCHVRNIGVLKEKVSKSIEVGIHDQISNSFEATRI
jgi:hypothetical protein